METEILEIDGGKYPVKIYYERRSNSRVSIRRTTINIRIPSFLEDKEKNEQLEKMKNWAKGKIIENPEKFRPKQQKEYEDSDIVKINDEEFILRIEFKDKKSSSARLAGNTIKLSISNNLSKEDQNTHISSLISRCIADKRLPKLQEKIYKLNKTHFNQKINRIFFKHNRSNWGSCSNAGNINISTRLLFAPDDILEYVCIHELAHLIEQNHSNKFWALVEKTMPDYKEKERWLKENGKLCEF